MNVFVVLYDNYGDQGYDFCGVFSSQGKAEAFIQGKESDDQRNYHIQEEVVQ